MINLDDVELQFSVEALRAQIQTLEAENRELKTENKRLNEIISILSE